MVVVVVVVVVGLDLVEQQILVLVVEGLIKLRSGKRASPATTQSKLALRSVRSVCGFLQEESWTVVSGE